jgi:site-specific recombinase XerD
MSRPIWQRFESVLADPITRYLAAKRSMGCRFDTEDRMLRVFDRYLTEQGVQSIGDVTSACLEAFMASRRRATGVSYNDLLSVLRRLLEWMIDQQELTSSPLTTQPQPHSARRLPYLFDPATIRRILDYAAQLPDNNRAPQRGPTYATIFALLAALGLRIGEVSRLQCGDVDLQREVILVRNSKFGKSRLVPFGPRLAARLRSYAALREQRLGLPIPEAPFFTWNGRSTIATNSIRNAFRDHLMPRLALSVPVGTRAPCVHGLRHSFAVRTLLRWYRDGVDPQARLNHLSTFLGHVGLHSTAVYLTITSELLEAANQRFEAFASPAPREVRHE